MEICIGFWLVQLRERRRLESDIRVGVQEI
jgi:hypothetical protein